MRPARLKRSLGELDPIAGPDTVSGLLEDRANAQHVLPSTEAELSRFYPTQSPRAT